MTIRTLFLIFLVDAGGAFQIHPRTLPRRISSIQSQAEDHMQELAHEWETLGEQLKEFAKGPKPDESKAKELTEQFIKTAIDHAHTREELEEEHIMEAHREFEEALEEEDQLTMTMPLLVDNTDFWMEPFRVATRLHENGTLMKKQIYQYLTTDYDPINDNLGMPGPMKLMEEYHDYCLETVHEKEQHALEEESEAKRTLEELRKNEEILKETLKEFETLQNKQKETLKDLKEVKEKRIEQKKQKESLNGLKNVKEEFLAPHDILNELA